MLLNVGFLTFDMLVNAYSKSGYLNVACRVLKCSRASLKRKRKKKEKRNGTLGEADLNFLT
jgi:hypothetical protein